MNSNFGKNFDFDLGLGSSRSKPLNEQKNKTSSYSSYSSSNSYSSAQSKPAWQPNKPAWTHQPAPGQAAGPGLVTPPTSMVGDIFGKTWASSGSSGSSTSIGVVTKNPNLFEDLVSSALGQGKGNSNVPLKNVTPAPVSSSVSSNKSSFSMGNMSSSLPNSTNPVKNSGNWGSAGSFNSNVGASNNRSSNLGGPSMKTMGSGGGVVGGMSSNRDPFGSLVDFGSKQSGSLNSGSNASKVDDVFGDFQNAPKSGNNTFQSSSYTAKTESFMGSNAGSGVKIDDFAMPASQPAVHSSSSDPLDMFFSSTTSSAGGAAASNNGLDGLVGEQSSGIDDWDSEFVGGDHDGGSTTELDGLPPPPAGVSASAAKNKGMDNYKAGQYADAIKWLSWAVILLERVGDSATVVDVLSSRASCYKEVGEYKKAVADCTKVLEQEDTNVSVLVQRALLYESMEKYKLGAEDLRNVLKIDPSNRLARSTVHRLTKLAD
ncbi:hypothetical protein UlMin_044579 [Ulmus minor]